MLTLRYILLLLMSLLINSPATFAEEDEKPTPGLNEATLKGLEWRSIGPAMTAGRVADIAVDSKDRSNWFVGVGSGGVWKTENRGTTWTPVFDSEGSYPIGCESWRWYRNTGFSIFQKPLLQR